MVADAQEVKIEEMRNKGTVYGQESRAIGTCWQGSKDRILTKMRTSSIAEDLDINDFGEEMIGILVPKDWRRQLLLFRTSSPCA